MTDRARLVLLSFLMLFVELALIRWTGSNVVYLSYFSNFVLLGSFLGIGIGFLRAGQRVNLWPAAPVALAGLVAFVLAFPVTIDRSGGQLLYFGEFGATGLPTWITLPLVFVLVAIVMAMIGEGVARKFIRFEPLEAYRLDILGSIAGIVAFTLLSFLRAPPVVWGVIAVLVFAVLLERLHVVHVAAFVVLVGGLLDESLQPRDSWSPYYKVTTVPITAADGSFVDVNVNGIPHQSIQSVDLRRQREPFYFLPYERMAQAPPRDVLVVGAGNGTDVAIALEQGVRHVDAVEIDPRLQEMGAELHPNRPYQDERVDVHIDDARAFLERTDKTYDLILFALPDSLTLVAGQSSLRLESFLFTREAMDEARSHLAPNGVFSMYNFYREPWLVRRLARTLEEAYGHPPCVDTVSKVGGLALLTTSSNSSAVDCPHPRTSFRSAPAPATDDYPFAYLRSRGVPGFYLLTLALILVAATVGVRLAAGPLRRMTAYADLFFMGCGFLLLETKSVVQFALWFGTTWFVNALVFTGILLAVFAAVEVARRFPLPPRKALYGLLFVSLAVAAAVPPSSLLNLPLPVRFGAAVLLAFAPIFLANLVFAQRFKDVAGAGAAFGANLLGAMLGGIAEYAGLVVGYRALVILAAAVYGVAFFLGRRAAARGPALAS